MLWLGSASAAPIPPSGFQPYQPLVVGARWNYACSDGIAAARTLVPGSVGPSSGFMNSLVFTIPGQPQVQYGELQTNDALGTRIGGFALAPTMPTATINPPQLEFPAEPVIGQTFAFPDGYGGTVTVTYAGFSTVATQAGRFNAGVFKEADNGRTPIPFPMTRYMVKGVGEVGFQIGPLAQSLPPTTCQLANYSIP